MSDNRGARRRYEDIAREIAKEIREGAFADSGLLPSERALVDRFGASRTSVREALLSLSASGLIVSRPSARARIAEVGSSAMLDQLSTSVESLLAQPNGVADFQEVRAMFECGLVRHAARHASSREIGRLRDALVRNREAIGDQASFIQTDLAFHDILAEIPRNPIFVALNRALGEWLADQRVIGLKTSWSKAAQEAYEGHRQVFEAVAAHDPEAADAAMRRHLKVVSRLYWQTVARQG